jgi:hypothetical protein
MSLFNHIISYSKSIRDERTVNDVLIHSFTEMGELALEVQINSGKSYKESGVDGVIGEALDVICCMIDIIYIENPNITEEEIMNLATEKLEKWKRNSLKIKDNG